MKRSVLTLAIAGVFAAPAMAQVGDNVQIYGRLNVGVDSYEAKGSAAGSNFDYKQRLRVFDTASRVGLRGTEHLGEGMRAIFQIETGVNVDNGSINGQSGVANSNTGFWASRDTWVGLEGDKWGRFTLGRQSAYWSNGTIEQIGANYINASSPLASFQQSGLMVGPVAREANVAQYSMRIEGFSATASYGNSARSFSGNSTYEAFQSVSSVSGAPIPTNTPGVFVVPNQVITKPRDQFYALTLRYNHAMFDLQADWATRNDVVGVPGRDASGLKLGAAWKYLPGSQLSVIYQGIKNKNVFGLGVSDAIPLPCTVGNAVPTAALGLPSFNGLPATVGGAFRSTGATPAGQTAINGCETLKQDMWVVSWEHTFGSFQALAQYGWAGGVSGAGGTAGLGDSDVQTYLLGGRYFLSKRTWLYASWNKISNGRNNYVDYWGGWVTSANQLGAAPGLPPTASGADPQIFAIGIFHNF